MELPAPSLITEFPTHFENFEQNSTITDADFFLLKEKIIATDLLISSYNNFKVKYDEHNDDMICLRKELESSQKNYQKSLLENLSLNKTLSDTKSLLQEYKSKYAHSELKEKSLEAHNKQLQQLLLNQEDKIGGSGNEIADWKAKYNKKVGVEKALKKRLTVAQEKIKNLNAEITTLTQQQQHSANLQVKMTNKEKLLLNLNKMQLDKSIMSDYLKNNEECQEKCPFEELKVDITGPLSCISIDSGISTEDIKYSQSRTPSIDGNNSPRVRRYSECHITDMYFNSEKNTKNKSNAEKFNNPIKLEYQSIAVNTELSIYDIDNLFEQLSKMKAEIEKKNEIPDSEITRIIECIHLPTLLSPIPHNKIDDEDLRTSNNSKRIKTKSKINLKQKLHQSLNQRKKIYDKCFKSLRNEINYNRKYLTRKIIKLECEMKRIQDTAPEDSKLTEKIEIPVLNASKDNVHKPDNTEIESLSAEIVQNESSENISGDKSDITNDDYIPDNSPAIKSTTHREFDLTNTININEDNNKLDENYSNQKIKKKNVVKVNELFGENSESDSDTEIDKRIPSMKRSIETYPNERDIKCKAKKIKLGPKESETTVDQVDSNLDLNFLKYQVSEIQKGIKINEGMAALDETEDVSEKDLTDSRINKLRKTRSRSANQSLEKIQPAIKIRKINHNTKEKILRKGVMNKRIESAQRISNSSTNLKLKPNLNTIPNDCSISNISIQTQTVNEILKKPEKINNEFSENINKIKHVDKNNKKQLVDHVSEVKTIIEHNSNPIINTSSASNLVKLNKVENKADENKIERNETNCNQEGQYCDSISLRLRKRISHFRPKNQSNDVEKDSSLKSTDVPDHIVETPEDQLPKQAKTDHSIQSPPNTSPNTTYNIKTRNASLQIRDKLDKEIDISDTCNYSTTDASTKSLSIVEEAPNRSSHILETYSGITSSNNVVDIDIPTKDTSVNIQRVNEHIPEVNAVSSRNITSNKLNFFCDNSTNAIPSDSDLPTQSIVKTPEVNIIHKRSIVQYEDDFSATTNSTIINPLRIFIKTQPKKNKLQKVCQVTIEKVEKMCKILKGYLVKDFTMKRLIELLNKTDDCNEIILANAIVSFVQGEIRSPTVTIDIPLMPTLPYCLQSCLSFLIQLNETKLSHYTHSIYEHVLEGIEYKLFNLVESPLSVEGTHLLAKLYAIICHITKQNDRVRIFCVDALYSLTFGAIPVICGVIDIWPFILPKAIHNTAKDPLVVVMVHHMLTVGDKDQFKQYNLKAKLMRYGFKSGDLNDDQVLKYLTDYLKNSGNLQLNDSLKSAFLIFGKRCGTEWCHKKLVIDVLLPIFEDVNYSSEIRAFAVQLIGPLIRPFPPSMTLQCEVIIKKLVLSLRTGASPLIEEAIVYSLSALSKKNYIYVVQEILKWRPKVPVSDNLTDILAKLATERNGKFLKNKILQK